MEKTLRKNTVYARLVFLLLALVLIVQLFKIQVLENNKWQVRSAIRNELRQTYQASRGSILYDDGTPLAVSQLAYGIFAMPDKFDADSIKKKGITKEKFAEDVSNIANGTNKETVLKRISDPKLKYVSVAVKQDPEVMDRISEIYPLSLQIWSYEEQAKRVYPDNQLAAKVVGFVGRDDSGNEIGRYGVEGYFDGILRGTEGIFDGKKDSRNQVIVNENFDNISSKNGIDVTLTINRSFQLMLEDRLMYWIDRVKAKEATAVIIEPNTGRILALANLPSYNPNLYWQGELVNCAIEYYSIANEECNKKPEPTPTPTPTIMPGETPDDYQARLKAYDELQKQLKADEEKVKAEAAKNNPETEKKEEEISPELREKLSRYPKAVQEILRVHKLPESEVYRDTANSFLYEPGSVVKVITLAIAYNYKTLPTDPAYNLGSHNGCELVVDTTLCTAGKVPRSNLTVEDMLQKSDNVGALRVAKTVAIKDFASTLTKFGLGKATGVELADETVYPIKDINTWSKVDQATASYGQGSVAYTPIQLASAWNILASNGKSFKSTVVKSINDNGQEKDFQPQFIEQVITPQAAKDALKVNAVATSKSIQKARDFYAKYPFTGKTGTANIPKLNSAGYEESVVNTSYLGSAPLENPRFTMLVWFREPRTSVDRDAPNGSNTAQVAWLDIAEKLMPKLGVAPQK